LYLVEMSPIPMAGVTGSMAIIVLEVMAFISLVSGYIVPKEQKGGISDQIWRILIALPALLNIIRFICLKFIYTHETPFFSINKRRTEEAMRTLKYLYTSDI